MAQSENVQYELVQSYTNRMMKIIKLRKKKTKGSFEFLFFKTCFFFLLKKRKLMFLERNLQLIFLTQSGTHHVRKSYEGLNKGHQEKSRGSLTLSLWSQME